jgi:hypothetical protein
MKYSKGDILVPKGKQFPENAIVVDGYDARGRMLMHPLGGGFQECVSPVSASVFRVVDEGERAGALFRRGRFVLGDSKEYFDGWTDGRCWNGWEMPRFEKKEAERLIRGLGDRRARFDATRDAFLTISQDGEEEIWAGEQIAISDGSAVRVYPVGAGSWIWDEVEP